MIEKLKNILFAKPLLSLAGVFILLPGIVLGVYLVGQMTQLSSKAAPPSAILSIVPASRDAGLNQEISFDIIFDKGTNRSRAAKITGADLFISADSNIQINRFVPDAASRLNTELQNQVVNGALRYAAANLRNDGSLPSDQIITLGKLFVQATGVGTLTVRFDDNNTHIVASGYKDEVPLSLRTAAVTVGGPLPSASSTAPPGIACVNGDVTAGAFHNGCVDQNDYNVWLLEIRGQLTTKTADFYTECNANNQKGDGVINVSDYNIWLREFNAGRNRCR